MNRAAIKSITGSSAGPRPPAGGEAGEDRHTHPGGPGGREHAERPEAVGGPSPGHQPDRVPEQERADDDPSIGSENWYSCFIHGAATEM